MTFVGKILVIVLMVFAVLFLGLSVVVFSTSTDWKAASKKYQDQVAEYQKKTNAANTERDQAIASRDASKADLEKSAAAWKAQGDQLKDEIDRRQKEIQDQRTQVGVAQESVRAAQQESEAATKEAGVLRDLLKKVQADADSLKLRQTELNQEILTLRRQIEVAQNNNKSLRENVAILQGTLRRAGLQADPTVLISRAQPKTDAEGEVSKVDARNKRVEITLGSDDGIVQGNELEVYRMSPTPEYLGRIRVDVVEADSAAATVISNPQGKKIREGDNVATKIRPRS